MADAMFCGRLAAMVLLKKMRRRRVWKRIQQKKRKTDRKPARGCKNATAQHYMGQRKYHERQCCSSGARNRE